MSNKHQALKIILWIESKWKLWFRKGLCQRCFNEEVLFHRHLVSVIRCKRQCKVAVNNINANDIRNDRTESAGAEGFLEATVENKR